MIDAITDTQLIWVDDNVVCERVNKILYDTKDPRIELTIYPVEYVGIFKNKQEYEQFESNCKTCSRYSNNCSILSKAKEGRIQDEIVNNVCTKYRLKKNKWIKGELHNEQEC